MYYLFQRLEDKMFNRKQLTIRKGEKNNLKADCLPAQILQGPVCYGGDWRGIQFLRLRTLLWSAVFGDSKTLKPVSFNVDYFATVTSRLCREQQMESVGLECDG